MYIDHGRCCNHSAVFVFHDDLNTMTTQGYPVKAHLSVFPKISLDLDAIDFHIQSVVILQCRIKQQRQLNLTLLVLHGCVILRICNLKRMIGSRKPALG